MKIAIITDGNNKLGMGHVYQAATLANEISENIDALSHIFFLTKSEQIVIDRLAETGFDVKKFPDDDAILNALIHEFPDRIIFDKLDVSPLLAKQIKEKIGCKLIIFTNLTDANKYADITVLAGMGSNFKNVCEKDMSSGSSHYYGPKYWLLRPEFLEYSTKKKPTLAKIKKIMLIFGAVDDSNLTSIVLNELMRFDAPFDIFVVVGSAFKHFKELQSVTNKNKPTKSRIHTMQNITNVAEMMFNVDLVITSPGLSYYEALLTGTPVIGFHQNEMQREVHKEHLKTIDKNEVFKLASMIKNKAFIFPDDPSISSMEIGQGKNEIIKAILI